MPTLTVYVSDALMRRLKEAKAKNPNLNISKIVQSALENALKEEG